MYAVIQVSTHARWNVLSIQFIFETRRFTHTHSTHLMQTEYEERKKYMYNERIVYSRDPCDSMVDLVVVVVQMLRVSKFDIRLLLARHRVSFLICMLKPTALYITDMLNITYYIILFGWCVMPLRPSIHGKCAGETVGIWWNVEFSGGGGNGTSNSINEERQTSSLMRM